MKRLHSSFNLTCTRFFTVSYGKHIYVFGGYNGIEKKHHGEVYSLDTGMFYPTLNTSQAVWVSKYLVQIKLVNWPPKIDVEIPFKAFLSDYVVLW